MSKLLTLLLASSMLAGCTLAPHYERPAAPVAQQWPAGISSTMPAGDAVDVASIGWQGMFRSPTLQRLISDALANNRDLRVAVLNIQAARDTYRIQRADLLPSIDATGSHTRQGVPENASITGSSQITSAAGANVGVTAYELDLFGRVRSLNRYAFNRYLATEEARKAAQVSLIAEVANAYLGYLADKELLQLTEGTLKTQQESYDVIKRSFEHGIGTQLDVSQAATQVETARANRAQYTRFVAQDLNALTQLVGAEIAPEVLQAENLNAVELMEELPVGLPSSVLLERPDVRQAEYLLKSENANIGAARAAFFPSISLTGSAGFASSNLSDLFSSGSGGAWVFAPQVSLPIFQGGRLLANLGLANTNRDIAVAQYEKAIQTAFREVSDELAARATYSEQLTAQQTLVAESERAYVISRARYNQGIDSHLSVLDAQRTLYTAQQNEILVRQQKLANLVNLYKVLGGGQEQISSSTKSN